MARLARATPQRLMNIGRRPSTRGPRLDSELTNFGTLAPTPQQQKERNKRYGSAFKIPTVSASGMPSQRLGRKCIWKAASTLRVALSSSPLRGTA